MRSFISRWIFLTAVLVLSVTHQSFAAPDSTEITTIFHIGNLNTDCLPDTVIGLSYFNVPKLPTHILWGKADSANPGCADTALGGSFFDSLKVDTTTISYPSWSGLKGSVSFLKLNSDTLTDVMFIVWGRADTGLAEHDTARFIGIMGQRGLDTFNLVDVGAIDSIQTLPFTSLSMARDSHYVNPQVREITGRISYIIGPVDLEVDSSGSGGAKPIAGESPYIGAHVALYPNPASESLTIRTAGLSPGPYEVEIYSSDGTPAFSTSVNVNNSKEWQRELDLRGFPSGSYFVRITGSDGIVGAYSLQIVR